MTPVSVDASGMAFYRYRRWRTDREKPAGYLKVHVAARDDGPLADFTVTDASVGDSTVFPEVLRGVRADIVRGDAGYCSRECVQLVEDSGGTPYILPKRSVTGIRRGGSDAWVHMLRAFHGDPEAWMAVYRQRWIVEAAFSSIKRRWDGRLASRTEKARRIETMLKCLVYSITRSIEWDLRFALGG